MASDHENFSSVMAAHRKVLKPVALQEIHEEVEENKPAEETTTETEDRPAATGEETPSERKLSRTSSFDEDQEKLARRIRSKSVGSSSHLARRPSEAEAPHQNRYTRGAAPIYEKQQNKRNSLYSSQEAIDSYYERNIGCDRPLDINGKLPFRAQIRPGGDNLSHMSTPGALGEPVAPTRRRFDKSIYWLSFSQNRVGFRHLFFTLLIFSYTMFGALMFYTIEGKNEREVEAEINHPNISTTLDSIRGYIRDAYIHLMKLESQYKGSTYYKLEEPEKNLKWTLSSAFFFCMNVHTTTGYGSIAPETTLGQVLTIAYAVIFLPTTLVVLRDLGQFCLVNSTKIYAHLLTHVRKAQGKKEIDHDEIISLPIKACIFIFLAYITMCTTFVYLYDDISGPDGISAFQSFYFSFVSLTTIGFGDVMPNNVTFAPIIAIMFFIGMSLARVVNRTTYIAVENGIFGTITVLENRLDMLANSIVAPKEEPSKSPRKISFDVPSMKEEESEEHEMLNNFTIKSIATFMKSNRDVYGGGFGMVQIRRGDLINNPEANMNSQDVNNVNS
ncbi:unnamed protein product [Caenorhabditis auriculariae]|uniref:Potassium channel domain-containing protein n=1 Tax=Caenorhabditis auriculariae TaxID=2777116 RepID=A0A8S1GW34_9PELO|nr:unnamed protein product [Caenorhabditis auriculariae]